MLNKINKELEASIQKGKNKIKVVKHGESIEFEELHSDKAFRKSIIGR